MKVDNCRVNILVKGRPDKGPVIYWMSRDQRVNDNWALIYAQQLAKENRVPFGVVFCLVTDFLSATLRQYHFMLHGLKQVEKSLHKKGIPFFLLPGQPQESIPEFIQKYKIGILVTDFDPLKIKVKWKREITKQVTIPFMEVDAHNIVPCKLASDKLEYGAYTLRPKITRLLPDFLIEYPEVETQTLTFPADIKDFIVSECVSVLTLDDKVKPLSDFPPGEEEAFSRMHDFIENNLPFYHEKKNNPNEEVTSNLSPYLHFGHISAQRIALEIVKKLPKDTNSDSFLEELIVRKELADNFCYYNPDYDSVNGFHSWAQKTLNEHRKDEREIIYSRQDFENAKTHDELWNAAQIEMVNTGKMHGYMRMYWAKKILEWTKGPEIALGIANYLNDRYELDGRDPNGYTGTAWSIGGIHDRAWSDRPVTGKIRYMSYSGCKRKFDIKQYISAFNQINTSTSIK